MADIFYEYHCIHPVKRPPGPGEGGGQKRPGTAANSNPPDVGFMTKWK